jgi:SAM-dependent methyltransferase
VLAVGRVPARSSVLDLGTGDGAVPATLRRTGCRVRAVEIDPVLAAGARKVCEQVVVADLETLDLASAFGAGSVDVVLALDVVGWVRDPVALLRRVTEEVLDPCGWIVLTLPNVGHASVRLRLLAGRFVAGRPRPAGAPSSIGGPFHYFDPSTRDALLDQAGLVALECRRVLAPMDPDSAELAADDPALLGRLATDPDALSAAYLVTAVPAGSPRLDEPPLLPAAAAQLVAADANARAEQLAARLAELEPAAGGLDELLPVLEAIRTASTSRRETLRSLLGMLGDNLDAMSAEAAR